MALYTLKVELGAETDALSYDAKDDHDAFIAALFNAVAKADGGSVLWKKGEIVLSDSEGRVVRTIVAAE